MSLTLLPGGRRHETDAALVARGIAAMHAASAPRNMRPTHPVHEPLPGVLLFDRAEHPDVPVLPLDVTMALSVLLRHVETPGSVGRPQQCEAALIVRQWCRPDADDCNARGIERPVS